MTAIPAPPTARRDGIGTALADALGLDPLRVVLVGDDLHLPDDVDAVRARQVVADYVPQPDPAVVNTQTIDGRLGVALDQLRAFVDAPKPSTAAAQASAAYDAAKLCARVCVGLVRLHLRRLDATD